MGYEKYYSGGWKSGEAGGTPITPEALNHMENGILNSAPAGYGIGKLTTYSVAGDAEIDSTLISVIKGMGEQTFKRIVLSFTTTSNFTSGGGHYYADIYKLSTNYAMITIKSYIGGGKEIQRIWFEGELKPWEWENPPLALGSEYRTTERIRGQAVYKKNFDGVIKYRLDGETTWMPYLNENGNAPAGYGGYGETLPYFSATDETDLESKLTQMLGSISPEQVKRVEFKIDTLAGVTIGDWLWEAEIYKTSATYAIVTARCGVRTKVTKIEKVLSNGTWQPVEWVIPPMNLNVEYRTPERWNGHVVYAKSVSFGALPNNTTKSSILLDPNLNVIDFQAFGIGTYCIPIPGYSAITTVGVTRSTGNVWVGTSSDMSSYNAYFIFKYYKD